MQTYYSNINRINEEVEEFVIAKNKIEKPLIDNETIEKKMSIKEFLDYIDLSKSSYIVNIENNIFPIAFNIQKPDKNTVVVIYSTAIEQNKQISEFQKKLEQIDYNLDNLKNISQIDIINGEFDLSTQNYFIINNNICI